MRWLARHVALLLAVVVISGCAGGPPEAPVEHSLPSTADAGAGTGAIHGLVTDDEALPVQGASVQVLHPSGDSSAPLEVVTGPDGSFTFEGLEPGRYTVFAGRLGYKQAPPQAAVVAEGKTTDVSIVLEALAVLEPYHESKNFVVQFDATLCINEYTVLGGCVFRSTLWGDSSNETYTWELDEQDVGVVHTMVVESEFQHELSVCDAGIEHMILSPGYQVGPFGLDESEEVWTNAPDDVYSPTYLYVPRAGGHENAMSARPDFDRDGRWAVYTEWFESGSFGTPVDVSCMTNAKIDLWWTIFFEEPSPSEDWSLLERA